MKIGERGNTLMYAVMALAGIGALTITTVNKSKLNRKTLQQVRYSTAVESFKGYFQNAFVDISICSENLEGTSLRVPAIVNGQKIVGIGGSKILNIRGEKVFEPGKGWAFNPGVAYSSMDIALGTLDPITHTMKNAKMYVDVLSNTADAGNKSIRIQYPLYIILNDTNDEIFKCFIDPDGAVSQAIEEGIVKTCQGAMVNGPVNDPEDCKFYDYSGLDNDSCGAGEILRRISYDGANGFQAECEKPVVYVPGTAPGSPSGCDIGFYLDTSGEYKCLKLDDIFSFTRTQYRAGQRCKVDDVGGKLQLVCQY